MIELSGFFEEDGTGIGADEGIMIGIGLNDEYNFTVLGEPVAVEVAFDLPLLPIAGAGIVSDFRLTIMRDT